MRSLEKQYQNLHRLTCLIGRFYEIGHDRDGFWRVLTGKGICLYCGRYEQVYDWLEARRAEEAA